MLCASRRDLCPTPQMRAVWKLLHDSCERHRRRGNGIGQAENASLEGLRQGFHFPISCLTCSLGLCTAPASSLCGAFRKGTRIWSNPQANPVVTARAAFPWLQQGTDDQLQKTTAPIVQILTVSRRSTKPPWLPWMSGPSVYTSTHIPRPWWLGGWLYLAPPPPRDTAAVRLETSTGSPGSQRIRISMWWER